MQTYTDFFNCINDALCSFAPGSDFVVYCTSRKHPNFPVISEYAVLAESRALNLSVRCTRKFNRSQVDEGTAWRKVAGEFIAHLLTMAQDGAFKEKKDIIY